MKRLFWIILFILLAGSVAAQNKTTQVGINLIKYFEGFKPVAYLCPAKVWTYGFGETEGVRPGMTITRARAELLLKTKSVVRFESHVNNAIQRLLKWYEFDALVSFSYNVGYRIKGQLRDAINLGNTKQAVVQLQSFCRANGIILSGLVKRRKAESALYQNNFSSGLLKGLL